jgi:RNA polymerase sigma-70 factor (ECF subfamily)
MDDGGAIARLRQGDIGGLEYLVHRYQIPALRAAYLILRDTVAAEDVVQGAFLRVYHSIAGFDPARPFGPWFLRVVANDALKAAARRERDVPLDLDEVGDALALPDRGPALDDLLAEAETSAAIWVALGKLSAEQRAAVVLRYYLDLSETEIAARLACPPGTVKSRLYAARQRLRSLLPPWLTPSAHRDL